MASSSSDEDEDERKKFAELAGIATKDIRDAYVKIERPISSSHASRRITKEVDEKEIADGLTPEFKKHIAKKLSFYIESCIEEQSDYPKKLKNSKKNIPGIHLFKLSKDKITDVESQFQKSTPKYPNKHAQSGSDSSDDDDEALARFAEAAVSGQSIIDNGVTGISNKEKDGNQNLLTEKDDSTELNKQKHKRKKKKKEKWKESNSDKDNHKRKKHKN